MPKRLLLMRAGIIDPTKVERVVALQHAASIAAVMRWIRRLTHAGGR